MFIKTNISNFKFNTSVTPSTTVPSSKKLELGKGPINTETYKLHVNSSTPEIMTDSYINIDLQRC